MTYDGSFPNNPSYKGSIPRRRVDTTIDLFLHRDDHEISFREAAIWSGASIAIGPGFGIGLWAWQGAEVAGYAGYLIEKALSVDNVFIFAMIFAAFATPERHSPS